MAGAQNGVGGFDEQRAQILASVSADASCPFGLAAVVEGRIEPNVFDEFARTGKTLDVADEGTQGKGDHFAHPAQPHDGEELRVAEHFLRRERGQDLNLEYPRSL